MELQEGELPSTFPDGGGFANVYILTRSYYSTPTESSGGVRSADGGPVPAHRQGCWAEGFSGAGLAGVQELREGRPSSLTRSRCSYQHPVFCGYPLPWKRAPWSVTAWSGGRRRHAPSSSCPPSGAQDGDYLLIQADEDLEIKAPAEKSVKGNFRSSRSFRPVRNGNACRS